MLLKSCTVPRVCGPLEREDLAALLREDEELGNRLANLVELSISIEGRGVRGMPFPTGGIVSAPPNTPSEKEPNWDQQRRSNYFCELNGNSNLASYSTGPASTPALTPSSSSRSLDAIAIVKDEDESSITHSADHIPLKSKTPDYRVASIPTPRPPLPTHPRPLTKTASHKETALHNRIKLIHFKACCYEERLEEDPSAEGILGPELGRLKEEIWVLRMKELDPGLTDPDPAPESVDQALEVTLTERKRHHGPMNSLMLTAGMVVVVLLSVFYVSHQ